MQAQKSLLGKNWVQLKSDEYEVNLIKQRLCISEFLALLLCSRGITIDTAHDFLSPMLKNCLPDPMHLLDMDKAVQRIIKAIHNKENICVFGDYDVDGATSTALLKRFFRDIGVKVDIYIPDRIKEGYGPSIYNIQKLKDSGKDLIITVDCGASSYEALELAHNCNLDVIVIDHHIGSNELPKAIAVVNPNRADETTEYKYLAAVGVSFLLTVALRLELRNIGYFKQYSEPNLMEYLDLVALGTVCDVMNLVGLNRAFVAQGLKILNQRKNIGLNAMSNLINVPLSMDSYHLGYVIGPRINAGGRVGKCDLGSKLLSTECPIEASYMVNELEVYNLARKQLEEQTLSEALSMSFNQLEDNVILVANEDWHPGVIGIVAGRIKDQLNKPVAVVSLLEDLGKASCRSVKGTDFGSKIIEAKKRGLLIAGGGHAMAAGFSIKKELLSELKDFLEEAFSYEVKNLVERNYYCLELPITGINKCVAQEALRLAPFGQGNPEPLFKITNVKIKQVTVMQGKHLSCILTDCNSGLCFVKAVIFNPPTNLYNTILENRFSYPVSLVGNIKINQWQEKERIQFFIKDIIC